MAGYKKKNLNLCGWSTRESQNAMITVTSGFHTIHTHIRRKREAGSPVLIWIFSYTKEVDSALKISSLRSVYYVLVGNAMRGIEVGTYVCTKHSCERLSNQPLPTAFSSPNGFPSSGRATICIGFVAA